MTTFGSEKSLQKFVLIHSSVHNDFSQVTRFGSALTPLKHHCDISLLRFENSLLGLKNSLFQLAGNSDKSTK